MSFEGALFPLCHNPSAGAPTLGKSPKHQNRCRRINSVSIRCVTATVPRPTLLTPESKAQTNPDFLTFLHDLWLDSKSGWHPAHRTILVVRYKLYSCGESVGS
jgi:hypothetical protein